jgi:acetyl-CoA carboxylase biotin carboxyl carrier protein
MSASAKPIDPALVRELAEILRSADLGEIEIERDDLRIRVSRMSSLPAQQQAPVSYTAAVPVATPSAAAPIAAIAPTAGPVVAPAGDHPGTVRSPMVGTVYLSADPNSPQFAPVGKTVAVGDTLMLIEAMKTFNPVTAAKAGIVKSILVSNEQPVEYDQPLIVIE